MSAETTRLLASIRQGLAGNLEGRFSEQALRLFFREHGDNGYAALCDSLVYMTAQMHKSWQNFQRDSGGAVHEDKLVFEMYGPEKHQ